jgi:hypothetical protein
MNLPMRTRIWPERTRKSKAVHVAYADLLNLTDEQTHGRVRELIEDTGGGLAEFLEEEMERQRRR